MVLCTQPKASSARAAELLAKDGTGFTGFAALGAAHALGGLPDSDVDLAAELRVLLKKLTKKDATTKVKSLKELSDLLVTCPDSVRIFGCCCCGGGRGGGGSGIGMKGTN